MLLWFAPKDQSCEIRLKVRDWEHSSHRNRSEATEGGRTDIIIAVCRAHGDDTENQTTTCNILQYDTYNIIFKNKRWDHNNNKVFDHQKQNQSIQKKAKKNNSTIMVNGQAMKQKLGSALAAQDSNGVAKALQLPPISTTKGPEPTPINRQSLTVNEVDYGTLLTSLLDACNAAECVSFHAVSLFFVAAVVFFLRVPFCVSLVSFFCGFPGSRHDLL